MGEQSLGQQQQLAGQCWHCDGSHRLRFEGVGRSLLLLHLQLLQPIAQGGICLCNARVSRNGYWLVADAATRHSESVRECIAHSTYPSIC